MDSPRCLFPLPLQIVTTLRGIQSADASIDTINCSKNPPASLRYQRAHRQVVHVESGSLAISCTAYQKWDTTSRFTLERSASVPIYIGKTLFGEDPACYFAPSLSLVFSLAPLD